jgi:hypothetical protein
MAVVFDGTVMLDIDVDFLQHSATFCHSNALCTQKSRAKEILLRLMFKKNNIAIK